MGNKKSVLASSRRDIEPSILPSQKFGDVIYVALVASIRLGILLKMFWAGCRTPPFYVSVTLIPFLLDRLQECGNVICSHAMILMSNQCNQWQTLQSMSNQWLKILSSIDYSSITHWLLIDYILVSLMSLIFIDEICLNVLHLSTPDWCHVADFAEGLHFQCRSQTKRPTEAGGSC